MGDPRNVPAETPAAGADGRRKRRMTARWRYTNRLNARASTGPTTVGGKARVAHNALRHGLSLPVLADPTIAPAIEALARQIAQSETGQRRDDVRHELACRIAATLIDLRRVRTAKRPLSAAVAADLENCDRPLEQLARLDRYERRALARRRRAIRAFYTAMVGEECVAQALRQIKAMEQKVNKSNEAPRAIRRARMSRTARPMPGRSAEQSHARKRE